MFQEGQKLGEFEILSRLGQGGMGAVYKARQVSLDRLVALKTLQQAYASDPEFIARFRREAKAAASLIHPNLVQVFSAGESDGLHWFAMEFVEGESAKTRLVRKGRLELMEAIAIATHIATALEYGWRKAHLIHRDIKPDNIFLSTDGEVKLGDLGLAKNVGGNSGDTALTVTGSSMGTPYYISPEQGQGKKDVDFRADIYSLGCTFYHLACGEPPYPGDTPLAVMMQHVTAPVPNLRDKLPACSEALATAVLKMMAKDPAHRQQTYAEVLADLRRAYDELAGASVPSIVPVTQPPQPALHPASHDAPTILSADLAAPIAMARAQTSLPPASVAAPLSAVRSPKSKLPLIAAAVAVLAVIGIVAFFVSRKKGPPTDGGGRSVASQTSPTAAEGWQEALPAVDPQRDAIKGSWKIVNGVLTNPVEKSGGMNSCAVPVSVRGAYDLLVKFAIERTEYATIFFTYEGHAGAFTIEGFPKQKGGPRLAGIESINGQSLSFQQTVTNRPQWLTVKEPHEILLELRPEGLTAHLDGEEIHRWRGDWKTITTPANWFSSDRAAPAFAIGSHDAGLSVQRFAWRPAQSAPAQFPPGQWVKIFTKPEDLPDSGRDAKGLKWQDGWIRGTNKKLPLPVDGISNLGVRARFLRGTNDKDPTGGTAGISLRVSGPRRYHSRMINTGLECIISADEEPKATLIFDIPAPPTVGNEFAIEFAVVGDKLMVRPDAAPAKVVADPRVKGSGAWIWGRDDVRDIEVINLDGLPEAEALRILGVDEKGNDIRRKATAKASPPPTPQVSKSPPSSPAVLTYAGHRFQLVEKRLNWHEAKAAAESTGGHLAIIGDKAKFDWVAANLSPRANYSYWLGGTKAQASTDWRWRDGTPVDPSFWLPGQPDVGTDAAGAKLSTSNGRVGLDDTPLNGEVAGYCIEWDTDTAEPWVDVLQEYFARPADQRREKVIESSPDGWKVTERRNFNISLGEKQNVALRATVRGMKNYLTLALRSSGGVTAKTAHNYQAMFEPNGRVRIIRYDLTLPTPDIELSHSAPIPAFSPDARHTFEFRAVDDVLTATVDGRVLEPVRDASFTKGELVFVGNDGMIVEKLELADLTGVKPAAAVASSSLPVITGWQDMMSTAKEAIPRVGQTDLKEDNGWLVATDYKGTATAPLDKKSYRDVAMRGRVRGFVHAILRADPALSGYYSVRFPRKGDGAIRLVKGADRQGVMLTQFQMNAVPEHDFLFTITGADLRLWVDGQLVATAHDATIASGPLGIALAEEGAAIRDLEVAELPADLASKLAPIAGGDETWTDGLAEWWADPKNPNSARLAKEAGGSRQVGASGIFTPRDFKDVALRVRAVGGGSTDFYKLNLRLTNVGYEACLKKEGKSSISLVEIKPGGKAEYTRLASFDLPAGFSITERHEMEFRMIKDVMEVFVDGQKVATARDSVGTHGTISIEGKGALFEKFEYRDLGEKSAAPAPAVASGEKWIDALTPALASWKGGSLWKPAGTGLLIAEYQGFSLVPAQFTDIAVRATARAGDANGMWQVRLRASAEQTGASVYKAILSADGQGRIQMEKGGKGTDLQTFTMPAGFSITDSHTMEFRAQGDRLSLAVDGREVATVQDATHRTGFFHLIGKPGTVYEKVEYRELPGAAPASPSNSTPANATKDAPFVNSLGMKFVPVPIGGGPTAGQRVLFGVWDVRVQDYAAYAAANPKADGSWKTQNKDGVPAGRELDHPVVGVFFGDAQAFCQWLTEKESAEGKLPKGFKYRLPSDEEWSWAVGLPPELGTTPAEKSGKNSVDFPWGKDWPPTRKVGNYADETYCAKFPKDSKDNEKDQPWIKDYNDGYATTSPTGSFPANAYGLYDMGGNVWQWCEDWYDKDQKDRVLRGASWGNDDRGTLLSSNRRLVAPGYRGYNYGFRCVLGESAR